DLPTVDMKKILQQWMFEDNTYKTHKVYNDLYEALQKSVELNYSNQLTSWGSELSPTDYLMHVNSIPKEQKPLPEEERPVTLEPAWTIPSSNKSDVVNNWASALAITYEPLAENSLLAKIGDMTTFMNCSDEGVTKMLIDQVDWTNPEGAQVRVDVNRPLPLGGPLGHVTIQTQFFFNKDLEYLRYGSKGSSPALSISKMKAVVI
ncbi:hypothetical protein Tco_0242063, partial [Tanacetum coccineum]